MPSCSLCRRRLLCSSASLRLLLFSDLQDWNVVFFPFLFFFKVHVPVLLPLRPSCRTTVEMLFHQSSVKKSPFYQKSLWFFFNQKTQKTNRFFFSHPEVTTLSNLWFLLNKRSCNFWVQNFRFYEDFYFFFNTNLQQWIVIFWHKVVFFFNKSQYFQ